MRDVLTNPTIGSALDLEEFRPELFAGVPEVLVPLAAELLWRGSFERGSRAVFLAREARIDPSRQPDLAVRFALVNTLYCSFVGEFDEALRHRDWAMSFEASATGVDDWIVTLDTLAMYCNTYVGAVRPGARARGHARRHQHDSSSHRHPVSGSDEPGRLARGIARRGGRVGRGRPRRRAPSRLRRAFLRVPCLADIGTARPRTARPRHGHRARRIRVGNGDRRATHVQLSRAARPGPHLGRRRTVGRARSPRSRPRVRAPERRLASAQRRRRARGSPPLRARRSTRRAHRGAAAADCDAAS